MEATTKSYFKNFINGLIIGAAMLVPGISGGTVAIILGIYDRLVASVASFFSSIKRNFLYLGSVALGGAIGFLLFSKPLSWLIDHYEVPMLCLFMGATCGSLPLLFRKTKSSKKPWMALYSLPGFALVLLLSFLPQDMFVFTNHSFAGFFLLFFTGIPLAAGFVLPGISLSYLMLVFGIHRPLLSALSGFEIMFLLPLGLGLAVGTMLVTRFIDKAMTHHPGPTYFIIIGFVLGSIIEIVRNLPTPDSFFIYPAAVVLFIIGAIAVWLYSRKSQ